MNYLIEPKNKHLDLNAANNSFQKAVRKQTLKILFLSAVLLVLTSLPIILLASSLFVAGYYFDSNPWFTLFPVGLLLMTIGGTKK